MVPDTPEMVSEMQDTPPCHLYERGNKPLFCLPAYFYILFLGCYFLKIRSKNFLIFGNCVLNFILGGNNYV